MIEKPKTSNEELVRLHRCGDRAAMSQLVAQNMGMVHQVTLRHLNQMDSFYDDAVQEAVIAVMTCAEDGKFDLGYGTQFVTYAWHAASRAICTFFRKNRLVRIPRDSDQAVLSGPDAEYALRDRRVVSNDLHVDLVHRDDAEQVLAAIGRLPDRLRDIITRRIDGEKLSSIGDSQGVCKERIRQLEKEARDRVLHDLAGRIVIRVARHGKTKRIHQVKSSCCDSTLHVKMEFGTYSVVGCWECGKRYVAVSESLVA